MTPRCVSDGYRFVLLVNDDGDLVILQARFHYK
jgi:Txe/YoeB family toxin of Txe-Axe toxin-antitoxin module